MSCNSAPRVTSSPKARAASRSASGVRAKLRTAARRLLRRRTAPPRIGTTHTSSARSFRSRRGRRISEWLISDDKNVEGDETIVLTLSNRRGLSSRHCRALITVRDETTSASTDTREDPDRSCAGTISTSQPRADTSGLNSGSTVPPAKRKRVREGRRVKVSAASSARSSSAEGPPRLPPASGGLRQGEVCASNSCRAQRSAQALSSQRRWKAQLEAKRKPSPTRSLSRRRSRHYPRYWAATVGEASHATRPLTLVGRAPTSPRAGEGHKTPRPSIGRWRRINLRQEGIPGRRLMEYSYRDATRITADSEFAG